MALTLLFTGLFVGIVSSFFGIGGGTIMMPILYGEFPQIPASVAIANSLAVIAITSLTNLLIFKKNGLKFHPQAALVIALSMGIFTILGAELSLQIPSQKLRLLLAWVLLFSALQTAFKSSKTYQKGNFSPNLETKTLILLFLASSTSGLMAGLTGLGGGIILIPFFLTVMKMPLRFVPLYTNVGMFAGTLLTFLLNLIREPSELLDFGAGQESFLSFQIGLNNFALIILLYAGSFVGSSLGVKGLTKLSDRQGKYLFILLQLFFAARLFIKNW